MSATVYDRESEIHEEEGMSKKDIRSIVSSMYEWIYGRPLSKKAVDTFVNLLLEEVSETEALQALKKWVKCESRFPTPADILKVTRSGRTPSELEIEAHRVTLTLMKACDHKTGRILPEVFGDDLISGVVAAAGGWDRIFERASRGYSALLGIVKETLQKLWLNDKKEYCNSGASNILEREENMAGGSGHA